MTKTQRRRDGIAVICGLVMPIAVAALMTPFRETFAATASALVLVTVVVAVAANGTRVAGLIAAVSATVWFDFFLTRPYERFAMTERPEIETAISLLIVGIAVTELAARNRYHHRFAEESSDDVGRIYYLSELVASGTPVENVIAQANVELIELLHLRTCTYVAGVADHRVTHIEHDGTIELGAVEWGVDQLGLPGREVDLLVQAHGETLGRFVFEPTPGWPVSLQRRLVAVALADQVGAALGQGLRSA